MFCSYCKEVDKLQAETNSSQAVGVTVKNFDPEPAIELWWNDATVKTTRRLVDAYRQTQRPRQVVITFYQFITNIVTPQLGFKK